MVNGEWVGPITIQHVLLTFIHLPDQLEQSGVMGRSYHRSPFTIHLTSHGNLHRIPVSYTHLTLPTSDLV